MRLSKLGLVLLLIPGVVGAQGCDNKPLCEWYEDLGASAIEKVCGGGTDTCWYCRCEAMDQMAVTFHADGELYGYACVPVQGPVDECDDHDVMPQMCANDPKWCKADMIETAQWYCDETPIATCVEDGDCPYVEEYCIDGICQHKPCECDDGSQDTLCVSATCQREEEMCQMGFCALEGF